MRTIFTGDSQIEVITVLANCSIDIDRARQALTKYIIRKQEKGRSTEHILIKLRQLELKFINDTSLHSAFRDARAITSLPRSPDLPLPGFVLREMAARRSSGFSPSGLRDITMPITPSPAPTLGPVPSTSQIWRQLPSSSVPPADTRTIEVEETRIQPEGRALRNVDESSLMRYSLPLTPRNSTVLSPYIHPLSASLSRSSTTQSSTTARFTHSSSPKRLRTSFNSPPPTSPLPDVPTDPPDDYNSHTPRLHLPSLKHLCHISWDSLSFSSSHSSFSTPPLRYSGFSFQPATIIRDDGYYSQQEEDKSPHWPAVIVEDDHSETGSPNMMIPDLESSFEASKSSGDDFPTPYSDSPILRERRMGALTLCAASPIVQSEVTKCLQQDYGYEQHNWPKRLQECGMDEEDIQFLLNEMDREAESISCV